MAILEKLRVRAGLLLAIVIGLALLAFVLGDFLDSGGSLFTRSKFEIAEISGKSIPYTDYENKVKELEAFQKLQSGQLSLDEATLDQIRNVTWENIIQDHLLEKQYEKAGIVVSDEELSDMITGVNPHPAIAQIFTDPQSGVFNRQAFNAFMDRIRNEEEPSDEKTYYLFIENEIFRQRKNTKYVNLLRKGMYATRFEADRQARETSRSVDADYIVKGFNTIADSAIAVTGNDLKQYYDKHKNEFKQKESRDIRYLTFDVTPSDQDFESVRQWINEILPDFASATDVQQFVNLESDMPFDEKNYGPGELNDSLNAFLFDAAEGTTYGPYFADNSFRISRLAKINYRPDSVKARHILLRVTQNNAQEMFLMADSIVNMLNTGSSFATLAMLYSGDGSAQSGGDLGWFKEGQMVKAFNDSCFAGRTGDIIKVATQFGIHVIEILDQSRPVKKIQVGTLVKNVTPSEATDHEYYAKANEFAGKNNTADKFNEALAQAEYAGRVRTALNLGPMEKRVNDLENARPLVFWAYKAEEGEVSTVMKFGNRYAVAVLDKARNEGIAPLDDVKAELENKVKQEKKAQKIMAEMNEARTGKTGLNEIASSLSLPVQPATGIRFVSSTFGPAGIEPEIVASVCNMEKGVVSEPIPGENGVYMINVTNITEPEANIESGIEVSRNYIERGYGAKTNYAAYEALKEMANIKDNRREFF